MLTWIQVCFPLKLDSRGNKFYKDYKKCINMVKLLLQNPILKLLSIADYLGSWNISHISAPNKTWFVMFLKMWKAEFCRLLGALLVVSLKKVEKNLQFCSPLVLLSGIKKYRHKCFFMVLLKMSFKTTSNGLIHVSWLSGFFDVTVSLD